MNVTPRYKRDAYRLLFLLLINSIIAPGAFSQRNDKTDPLRTVQDTVIAATGKKAGKRLGKRLYDLVSVDTASYDEKLIRNKSLSDFSEHNGLVINNITIVRLDPFGTSILTPDAVTDNRVDRFLNRTHVVTKERIIRNYLLFAKGDTISDLSLSETERNLRQLSFINDARINVVPLSGGEADVVVVTRDDYSIGAGFNYTNPEKGEISFFEKNIYGFAHELEIGIPYDLQASVRTGLKMEYKITNIARSFANLEMFAIATPQLKSYGFRLERDFISAESEYAGAATVQETFTYNSLDTMASDEPVEYTYQDYWFARSYLLNKNNVSRLIFGARYIHNNVYTRPEIDPMSYYSLQKYRLYLGSVSFSRQKFYKTSLIYNFGRTEDIPYGGLVVFTVGREYNEFKQRHYIGSSFSWGNAPSELGYFNLSASAATFFEESGKTEQGILDLSLNYFSGLISMGNWNARGFVNSRFTRGFDRYADEYLTLIKDESVTGFRNDSIRGQKRFSVNLETVLFSPLKVYGFRFIFFGFTDMAFLGSTKENSLSPGPVTGIGAGVRIRNDNLIINTFQIRLGYYPGLPLYSRADHIYFSGESLLKPRNFDAGPPSLIVYR
jgi:outer membrane protein assembly factor BamA